MFERAKALLFVRVQETNPRFRIPGHNAIMTHFDETNRHGKTVRAQIRRTAPPTFPGGPEVIDTQALWGLIPGLFAQLHALFTPQRVARGAISRIWEIRARLQSLYRAEKSNFRLWLIRALKADPAWKAQVRRDLGGDAAMTRWEQRFNKLNTTPAAASPHIVAQNPVAQVRSPDQTPRPVKTDRSGLFRLAAIFRPAEAAQRPPRPSLYAQRDVACLFYRPGAFSITPDDLRPAVAKTAQIGNSNAPAPNRRRILQIWQGLHLALLEWNFQLILADVATVVPACRADILPP